MFGWRAMVTLGRRSTSSADLPRLVTRQGRRTRDGCTSRHTIEQDVQGPTQQKSLSTFWTGVPSRRAAARNKSRRSSSLAAIRSRNAAFITVAAPQSAVDARATEQRLVVGARVRDRRPREEGLSQRPPAPKLETGRFPAFFCTFRFVCNCLRVLDFVCYFSVHERCR